MPSLRHVSIKLSLFSFLIKHMGTFSYEPLQSLIKECYSLVFLLGLIVGEILLGHGGKAVAKLLMIPYVSKSTFLLLLRVCNIISASSMQYT